MPISDELKARIEKARSLDGSIVVCLGPSGCGKTDLAVRLSLAAAFIAGVEWLAYDSNGDVRVHLNGIRAYHRQQFENATTPEERSRHFAKLAFLDKCIRTGFYSGPSQLPRVMAKLRDMVAQGHVDAKSGKSKKVRAIVFVDEAGAVRDANEEFWPAMRQARNAGVTIYTTGHRLKDWHPAARANIRVAVVWRPKSAEKFVDVNGLKIPREACAEPKGDVVKFWIGDDPVAQCWNRAREPERYPPELVIPAQPTVARVAGF